MADYAIHDTTLTGISNVIRKKEGSSALIDPADYPKRINLMGMLEEKTQASASVCSFSDGADAVPLKNWLVTLPASLSGYSEVNGTKNTGTDTPTTQYTASLGRTIYGGTADLVNGEGTGSGVKYTLDGTQAVAMFSTTDPNVKRFSVSIPSDSITTTTDRTDIISDVDILPTTTNAVTSAGGNGIHYRTNGSHNIIVCFGTDVPLSSVEEYNAYVSEHNIEIVYTLATPTDFTFTPISPTPETALGYNAFWSDEGDTEVTYRASGTITPVVPTLISKTITENGTYSAEDDNADGYDEVTVNVPPIRNVYASIASFSDSDTSTPLLSVKSIVSPTSIGISSVVFKHVGKNHIQKAKIVQGSFNSDGGDVDVITTRIRIDNYIPLTAGTYKIENKEGYEYVLYVYSSNNWQSYISAESLVSWQAYGSTFTLANDRYVRIGWRKSNNADILPSEIHDYILYDTSSLTQITANLGRTIYGGEVDAVNGTGTDEDGNDFTFTGQAINAYSGENNIYNASGNTEVEYVREVST